MNKTSQTSLNANPIDLNRFADDTPIRRLGYLFVVVMFGAFGAWSFFRSARQRGVSTG
ncbi:hypothetical protein [Methylocucumis oryzae]|uniref:hypothetical protein n=1 Tax=Methylocucumis oryzae TaxID=1632867 RepID=UPI00195546B0|nr:hypothetical protein [Methylocucumis oryzae]